MSQWRGRPGSQRPPRPLRFCFFSSRRRHTRSLRDWSSDVCSSDAEHTAYGLTLPPLKERFDRYAEQLEIITGLWKTPLGSTYSFDGRHYQLVDSPALPKPAQQPSPPVIIGGGGKKRTPELAARFADEFNLPFADTETASAQFARVAAAAEAIGRDPQEILRSVALVIAVGRDDV